MKSKEELNELKEEVKTVNQSEALAGEELEQVAGGNGGGDTYDNCYCPYCKINSLKFDHNDALSGRDYYVCECCLRKFTHVWEGNLWEEGWT